MYLKLKLEPGQRVFFTSDTHYNHAQICRGTTKWTNNGSIAFLEQTRDFNTLEEMNDHLVSNINEKVGEKDILFSLGDWSFAGEDTGVSGLPQIWNFRQRIKCRNIYAVLGNHDHHIGKNKVLPNCHRVDSKIIDGGYEGIAGTLPVTTQELFKGVYDLLELEVVRSLGKNQKSIRKRYFLSHYPIQSWKDMNQGVIHLHGHVHLPPHRKLDVGLKLDVGVEGNEYVPYEDVEILKIMEDQPVKSSLQFDHHIARR
jgi:calcineurin-like phosphoesterase family protein